MGIKAPPLGVVQKMQDFGSTDAFIARMWFQIFELRDHIYPATKNVDEFGKLYDPILQNLTEARHVKDKAIELIEGHTQKVMTGKVSRFDGKALHIEENIGIDLNIWFKDFFIRGKIATDMMIRLAKFLDYDISFVFAEEEKFEKEKKKLQLTKPGGITNYLLDLITDHRNNWYKPFVKMRIAIEHHGYQLPEIKYGLTQESKAIVVFPIIEGRNIPDLLNMLWENLFLLCEDVIVLMMSSKVKEPFAIRHIPEAQRNPEMPVRYKIDFFPTEGLKKITYADTKKGL